MATPCAAVAGVVPAKIPLSQHNPDMVKLDSETRLIIHTIRMAACNAETILARSSRTYAPICRDTPETSDTTRFIRKSGMSERAAPLDGYRICGPRDSR